MQQILTDTITTNQVKNIMWEEQTEITSIYKHTVYVPNFNNFFFYPSITNLRFSSTKHVLDFLVVHKTCKCNVIYFWHMFSSY